MAVDLTAGTPAFSTASVTTVNVDLPAGMAAGDYTVVTVALNASNGTINPPAGWVEVLPSTRGTASSSLAHAIFYRKWVSGDPASVAVTHTNGRVGALPVRVTGADPDTFLGKAATVSQAAASATVLFAPIATPDTGDLVVHTWAARSPTNGTILTLTPSAGVAEVGQVSGRSGSATNAATLIGTSTGGAQDATASASTTGAMGVSFIIKAAAGEEPPPEPPANVYADPYFADPATNTARSTAGWTVGGGQAVWPGPADASFYLNPTNAWGPAGLPPEGVYEIKVTFSGAVPSASFWATPADAITGWSTEGQTLTGNLVVPAEGLTALALWVGGPATVTHISIAAAGTVEPPGSDVSRPELKETIFQFVSTVENSTFNWWEQYGYVEALPYDKTMRGYTCGIIGFTTGTFDATMVVEEYETLKPGNSFSADFLPTLRNIDAYADNATRGDYSIGLLEPMGYPARWAAEANDPLFRQAQRNIRDDKYWDPALTQAVADGVSDLGMLVYYDTIVNHGSWPGPPPGYGTFEWCRAEALKTTQTPGSGGDEKAYLNALLDARWVILTEWGDANPSGRVPALRGFVTAERFDLTIPPTLAWSMYGTPFSLTTQPVAGEYTPQPTAQALAGTSTVTSATTGTITGRFRLAGTVTVTSGSSGALSGATGLAGTSPAVSATTGTITARLRVSGTATVTSATTGALSGTTGMAGTSVTVSATTGQITARLRLSGTSAVASGTSGTLGGPPAPPPPVLDWAVWQPRHRTQAGWTAQLMSTMTGDATPPIQLLGGSWTDGPLNDATSGTIRVPVSELRRFDDWWWSKWSGSVLLCWRGAPVVAGPILTDPSGWGTVDLKFGGLFSLLEYRYATNQDYGPGQGEQLAHSELNYAGMNLGGIAADLTRRALDRPSGGFPLRVASPNEAGTVDRVRNYQGHNISNNSVAKLVKEITAVINGPDVAYRPEWVEPGARAGWVMYHGTEGLPQIVQDREHTIDLTAPRARLMEPAIHKETTQIFRAYMTGQGEGPATEIVIAERAGGQPPYLPMLETVVSDSQATNKHGLLSERGAAVVAPEEIVQLSVNLPVDDPAMPLSSWFTGDEFITRVPDLLHIRRGTYRMRAVSRSGSVTSTVTKVELQPEAVIQR